MKYLVNDKLVIKSMVGNRIWALKETNLEHFQTELKAYFALGYPGFTILGDDYPYIFLIDEREPG